MQQQRLKVSEHGVSTFLPTEVAVRGPGFKSKAVLFLNAAGEILVLAFWRSASSWGKILLASSRLPNVKTANPPLLIHLAPPGASSGLTTTFIINSAPHFIKVLGMMIGRRDNPLLKRDNVFYRG